MRTNEIAIICEGKEVSYGLNLKHLFYFDNNGKQHYSDFGSKKTVEIYTPTVFRRENITRKAVKVYIGSTGQIQENYSIIFDCFGMSVYKSDNIFVAYADSLKIVNGEYDRFINYANTKRNEYIKAEKQYFDTVNATDPRWISGEFIRSSQTGLLSKSNSLQKRKQQQYECLAYVLYLEYLKD